MNIEINIIVLPLINKFIKIFSSEYNKNIILLNSKLIREGINQYDDGKIIILIYDLIQLIDIIIDDDGSNTENKLFIIFI